MAATALVLDDLGTEYLDDKGSFLVDLDELIDVFSWEPRNAREEGGAILEPRFEPRYP